MPHSQHVAAADPRLIWSGAISCQSSRDWVMPWRLPSDDLALFPTEGLQYAAAMSAGVRLRFATDAETLTLATEPMEGPGAVDVYANDRFVGTFPFAPGDTAITCAGLPAGETTLECWLPPTTPFRLREIRLPAGATVARAEDPRPRWVTYGSSITHCSGAQSPSMTWPGVVARGLGLNLTSLGYNGQCHADPMMARMIRDVPADLISVKVGINIYGMGSLNERTFLPAVLGLLATIRDGHPDTPLVVCSPIWCPARETTPNAVGMTLEMMRASITTAVETFRARGDRRMYYIDGRDLFGPALADHLPDGLHPDGEGYRMLGERFIAALERLGVQPLQRQIV